jgi:hypothetical protein
MVLIGKHSLSVIEILFIFPRCNRGAEFFGEGVRATKTTLQKSSRTVQVAATLTLRNVCV